MKRSKIKVCVLALTFSMLLSACGEKPIQLTEGEEEAIVNYAAHVVSKYNTRQPDGLTHVLLAEQEGETEETPIEAEAIEQTSELPAQDLPMDSPEQEKPQEKNLTQALGIEGITAEYTGAELTATYSQADYYAVDAAAGYQFMAVNITLTNTSDADISIDMLEQQPVFQAYVNDSVTTTAQTTILLNDLGTYQGTIAAGDSAQTVLLFQVSADDVQSVDRIMLTVRIDGNSSDVTL